MRNAERLEPRAVHRRCRGPRSTHPCGGSRRHDRKAAASCRRRHSPHASGCPATTEESTPPDMANHERASPIRINSDGIAHSLNYRSVNIHHASVVDWAGPACSVCVQFAGSGPSGQDPRYGQPAPGCNNFLFVRKHTAIQPDCTVLIQFCRFVCQMLVSD